MFKKNALFGLMALLVLVPKMMRANDTYVFASGSKDGILTLWEFEPKTGVIENRVVKQYITSKGYGDSINSMSFSSDGKLLAFSLSSGIINVLDIETEKISEVDKNDKIPGYASLRSKDVSFINDSTKLVIFDNQFVLEKVAIYTKDFKSKGGKRSYLWNFDGRINAKSFSSDGSKFACILYDFPLYDIFL